MCRCSKSLAVPCNCMNSMFMTPSSCVCAPRGSSGCCVCGWWSCSSSSLSCFGVFDARSTSMCYAGILSFKLKWILCWGSIFSRDKKSVVGFLVPEAWVKVKINWTVWSQRFPSFGGSCFTGKKIDFLPFCRSWLFCASSFPTICFQTRRRQNYWLKTRWTFWLKTFDHL